MYRFTKITLSTAMLVSAVVSMSHHTDAAENGRGLQSGVLLETEKIQVKQGDITTSRVQGSAKYKKDKTEYGQHATSTTRDNNDTYQVFTIRSGGKMYSARERLLFPWSKPAVVTVGETVTFSVQRNTMYLLGEDGKQHKASISKVSMADSE